MTANLLASALRRVPDQPGHVDVRGILLSGKADIRIDAGGDPARDPLIVLLPARSLASTW